MTMLVTRCMLDDFNNIANEDERSEISLLEKYRIRVCPGSMLPIWQNSTFSNTDIIVIDRLTTKEDNNEFMEIEKHARISLGNGISDMDTDDYDGCPLTFEFLTLASMKSTETWTGPRRCVSAVGIDYFKCNPIPTKDALELRDRLIPSNYLEASLCGLPLVFITDASDRDNTALLSVQSNKNKITSSLTTFNGKASNDVLEKLRHLSKRFASFERRSKATAVYSILSNKNSGLWVRGALLAKMNLTFKWQEGIQGDTFLAPPSPSATAILYVAPGWKDVRIALYEKTKELEFILCLAKTLSENTPMIWPKTEETPENILQRVSDLIGRSRGIQRDSASENMRFLDFTEHLWAILKACDGYDTLLSALKLVFTALKELRVNTILHHDNKSTIARLVRDSLSGELLLPRLEALTPVQLLLEMGIERFRRDMIHSFVNEALATSENELLDPRATSNSPEQRAYALLPMHLALQTMMEIKKNLQISSHQIVNMTRVVLHQYCSTQISDISKIFFETEVSFVDIKPDIVENVQPMLWTNETVYMDKTPVANTVVSFFKESSFKHLEKYIHRELKDNEKEEFNEKYLCSLTTSSYINRNCF